MTTPWRRLAWTLVLITLGSLWLARDAAAYWGVTTLDYGGQLTGYARVEQEVWDPDVDWVCTYGDDFPPYGWICLEGVETFYSVGLEHELRTPTGALHASGAGSSPNGWLQLNLPPHTPTVYGTWTHHGWYSTVEDQYLYVFNPNTFNYDVSPLGLYWVQFGGHSPQVNVPEPSPPPALVHYVHTDALGSVRLLTDAAGQPVTECDYLPFGQDWQSTGDLDECRFAQTERAADTGAGSWEALNYAGARYYHSQSGRFTSVDPGHVGLNLLDPQSWNGYAYAGNNPLRYVDPTGTDYLIHGYALEPGIFEGSYSDLESALEGTIYRLDGNSFRGVILGVENSPVASYERIWLGPGGGGVSAGGGGGGGGGGPARPPQDATQPLLYCRPDVINSMKLAYDNTRQDRVEWGFAVTGSPTSYDIGALTKGTSTGISIEIRTTRERPFLAMFHTHPTGDWRPSSLDRSNANRFRVQWFMITRSGLGLYDGATRANPVLVRQGLEWQNPC